MRVAFLALLLFIGVCLSSPSSSSSSSSVLSSPSTNSWLATKQKTYTKALRSLIGASTMEDKKGERGVSGREEEGEESWGKWVVSSTNEVISLGLMVVRAPIVNLLPRGTSTDVFKEFHPHRPKNEEVDLDISPEKEEEETVLGKLSGSYTSFFRSMNLPGVLDSMLGEVVVGHVSQNDGDSVRRFQQSQSILKKKGVFSHPSSITASASLPSSSSSSSSTSSSLPTSLGEKIVGFKERMVMEMGGSEKRKREEQVCGGVGVEIEVEVPADNSTTDDTPHFEIKCACPVDYIGEECELFRPFDCSFSLITPRSSCEPSPYGVGYEGSPSCFRYSLKDKVTLSYQMKCGFQTPPENPDFNPFDYDLYLTEIVSDNSDSDDGTDNIPIELTTFALSKGRKDEFFSFMKVFNFNRFGDLSASQDQFLSLDQIRGMETIDFSLDFSKINQDRFIFGKRMYVETGLQTLGNGIKKEIQGLSKNIKDRRHFDFSDTKIREAPFDYMSVSWKRFLLLYIALGVSGVLFIVYWGNKCVKYMSKVDKEE